MSNTNLSGDAKTYHDAWWEAESQLVIVRNERDALADIIETHQEAATMKAALDRSEAQRAEAAGLLSEWFEHDAEPHLHGPAEDDPGGEFCNECGRSMPCFTLRAAALFAAASGEAT